MSDESRSSLSTSTAVIRQGVDIAPELRSGLGLTVVLALLGTGSRLVIPILLRQIIDNGFVDGKMRTQFVTLLCVAGLLSVLLGFASKSPASCRHKLSNASCRLQIVPCKLLSSSCRPHAVARMLVACKLAHASCLLQAVTCKLSAASCKFAFARMLH